MAFEKILWLLQNRFLPPSPLKKDREQYRPVEKRGKQFHLLFAVLRMIEMDGSGVDTGGEGTWKPVITCWVHLELMCIFPTM